MSRIVVMDLREHNTVLAGHDRYFVLVGPDGDSHLVRDWCPHRGGPLSLSRLTPDGRRLTCPWHGTKVGVAAVRRTGLPMVRSGDEAIVLLPDTPDDVPVTLVHKRILANLPPEDPDRPGSDGPDGSAGPAGPAGTVEDCAELPALPCEEQR